MRITVPGNLLLMGEYAITLPGGAGIAAAVENAQVVIEAYKSPSLKIRSTFQGDLSLPKKILEGIDDLDVRIDSSQFYDAGGRKKGFGSSAAVCVGLTYLRLKHLCSREPDLKNEVFPFALQLHREFQEGKGSGYDVCASLFGGISLFSGGAMPSRKQLESLPMLYLLRGEKPVISSGAVCKFEQFCQANPRLADKYFRLSNRIVYRFIEKPDERNFLRASSLNRWLHRQLEMPQTIPEDYTIKALGAGDEIMAVMGADLPLEKMVLAGEGLQCQQ